MIYELSIYSVSIETNESSKTQYTGSNKEEAREIFLNTDIDDLYDKEKNYGATCILWKQNNQYKFIYVLNEDEYVSDYPIDEYYDNSEYYQLINEGMNEEIDSKDIKGFNDIEEEEKDKANEVLNNIVNYFKNKYPIHQKSGYFINPSHYFLIPLSENSNIKLRVSNHSMNPDNIELNDNIIINTELVKKGDLPKRIEISENHLYDIIYYDDIDYVTYRQLKPKNRCYIFSAVIFYSDDETEDVFDSFNKDKNVNWKQERYDLSKNQLDADELIMDIEKEIDELKYECEENCYVSFQKYNSLKKQIRSPFEILFFKL